MDLSKLIGRKQEPQPEENRLSKEEYAALKKAEREELWAKVDNQAQAVFQDDASLKGFLNFMAQCTPQSTRNLLILYEQNPEALLFPACRQAFTASLTAAESGILSMYNS